MVDSGDAVIKQMLFCLGKCMQQAHYRFTSDGTQSWLKKCTIIYKPPPLWVCLEKATKVCPVLLIPWYYILYMHVTYMYAY